VVVLLFGRRKCIGLVKREKRVCIGVRFYGKVLKI